MTMPTSPAGYTIYHRKIPEVIVPGKRLGRHVRVDSRSARYQYRAPAGVVLQDQLWTRHIPILDQGNVGSCTGDEQTGILGTSPFWETLSAAVQASLDQNYAYGVYSDAENLDGDGPYPPNDYGSSGESAAKVVLNRGLISGFVEINNSDDMAAALQDGPVGVGSNWYDSMDSPDGNGLVSITPGAYVRGGHEYEIRGVKIAERLFLADNSWGADFANAGSFEVGWDTMNRLLTEQGDCTRCLPLSVPAPVPTPVPSDPDHLFWFGGPGQYLYGGLQNWTRQVRTRPDLQALQHDARSWAKTKGLPT